METSDHTIENLMRKLEMTSNESKRILSDLELLTDRYPTSNSSRSQYTKLVLPTDTTTTEIDATSELSQTTSSTYHTLMNMDGVQPTQVMARVYQLESTVHSVKLHLLTLQTERERTLQTQNEITDKLKQAKRLFQLEYSSWEKKTTRLSQEKTHLEQQKSALESKISELESNLDDFTFRENELSSRLESRDVATERANRRCQELQDRLAKETELRSCLEQTNAALQERLNDMELNGSQDQELKESQLQEISKLQSEVIQMQHKLANSDLEKNTLRAQLVANGNEAASTLKKLDNSDKDKHLLIKEFKKLKQESAKSCGQLTKKVEHVMKESAEKEQIWHKDNLELKSQISKLEEEKMRVASELTAEIRSLNDKFDSDATVIEFREKVRKERRRGDALETQVEEVTQCIQVLQDQLYEKNQEMQLCRDRERSLAVELDSLKHYLEEVEADKKQLVERVSSCMDDMTGERNRLDLALGQVQTQLVSVQAAREHLEGENAELCARVHASEVSDSVQLESKLRELADSKQRLAFERGRLQTRVEELQNDLDRAGDSQSVISNLRIQLAAAESQSKAAEQNVSRLRTQVAELQHEVKRLQDKSERKEVNISSVTQSKEEAVSEAARLLQHCAAVEDRERRRVEAAERRVEEANQQAKKSHDQLTAVVSQVSGLQCQLDLLQTELGCKETEISTLQQDKARAEARLVQLQSEMETVTARLVHLDHKETSEMQPLRETVMSLRSEKGKLGGQMAALCAKNEQLRHALHGLQAEIEKERGKQEKMNEARRHDEELHQKSLQNQQEKMRSMQEQLNQERASSHRIQLRLTDTQAKLAELTGRLEGLQLAKEAMEAETTAVESRLAASESQRRTLQEKEHKAQTEKSLLCSRLQEQSRQLEAAMTEIADISSQVTQLGKASSLNQKHTTASASSLADYIHKHEAALKVPNLPSITSSGHRAESDFAAYLENQFQALKSSSLASDLDKHREDLAVAELRHTPASSWSNLLAEI